MKAGVAMALVLSLSACGMFGGGRGADETVTQDAQTLYRQGEAELERGRYDDAAGAFLEIEREYPYTEWARRALIMATYSFHEDGDYENSRASAQRFLDFYPADEDAAYAQYLLALSYYDQIDQVGRDQGLTYRALQELRLVIERYPDSEYAASAMLKFDLAFDHLAGKEMEIGRYYLRRQNYTAAINRFRVVVEDFQTTSHTPEALMRLVEAYIALGLPAEAQTAAAILGHNFQGSPFYDDAFRLLNDMDLAPEAAGESWLREIWQQTVRGEWL